MPLATGQRNCFCRGCRVEHQKQLVSRLTGYIAGCPERQYLRMEAVYGNQIGEHIINRGHPQNGMGLAECDQPLVILEGFPVWLLLQQIPFDAVDRIG